MATPEQMGRGQAVMQQIMADMPDASDEEQFAELRRRWNEVEYLEAAVSEPHDSETSP